MKNLFHAKILFLLITAVACNSRPVSVSQANPHYFSYKGRTLVLITSDHHYGAVIDRDFDYKKYLDYLSLTGMNLTRIYPGGMFEPTDKYLPGNPLGPRSGRQLLPWARSDSPGANPLLSEAGQPSYKYDLDKWDPSYFKRLKEFVSYAGKKGIIVEIPFFNGMYNDCWPIMPFYHKNNIQNVGKYEAAICGLFTSNNPLNRDVVKYQKEYIKKITRELNAFDNLIYDISDEPSLQGLPGGSCLFLPDSQVIQWVNEMKDAFLDAEKTLPRKHILGQTVQNLSPDMSGELWCQWLPTEYVKPAEKALKQNYANKKPLVNVESNYFGMSLTKNGYGEDAVRLEGWWFMLGGGAGCINLNGEFYRGHETGGRATRTRIVPERKILKDFMNSLNLAAVERFTDFTLSNDSVFCNMLGNTGTEYALYLFHGDFENEWGAHFIPRPGSYTDSINLRNIPGGNYLAEWIDPSTGIAISSEVINSRGGDISLKTPPYQLDIAMRMTNKDKIRKK